MSVGGHRAGGVSRRRPVAAWSTACVLLVAGCTGTSAPPAPTPALSAPAPSSAAPSTTASSGAGAASFTNPVYDTDFPDPMIVRDGDRYVAVATNGNGSNVQVATSADLVHWEQGEDALPKLPRWSTSGKVWAPEIARQSGSRFLLYYTTIAPDGMRQCISVAAGRRAEGPYVDSSRRPLVCDDIEEGGSIDPHPFRDEDGRRYLYWKNDGNAVGADTYLWVQQLDAEGTDVVGKARRLIKQDQPWEGSLIEAPFVVRSGATYHLFYSANDYGSWSYAEGHATGTSPTGPFRKDPEPVLASNDVAAGPGGGALLVDEGRVWMAYHAWDPEGIGSAVPGRQLWLSEVTLDPARTVVEPPEVTNADPPDAGK